mgnify:CR=1 FL=1
MNELIFDAKEESGIRNAVVAAMLLSDDDGYSYCEIKVSIYKSDEAVFDFEKATGGDRMFAWNREVSNSTMKMISIIVWLIRTRIWMYPIHLLWI